MSVVTITAALQSRMTDLAGLGARYNFDFGDDGVVGLDATQMPPLISTEAQDDPDCTIRLSIADMQKLISGRLNATLAYTLGKLKVDGSLGYAMKLASVLDD